jgi:5-formyltetrahydrofolate cyclo-ligase
VIKLPEKFSDTVVMDRKSELRQGFKQRLASMNAGEKEQYSRVLCEHVASLAEFVEARHIFAFLPLPSEPDILPLIAGNPGKRWSFPRVDLDGRMSFYRLETLQDTMVGAFGIREPGLHCELSDPTEAGLVLVPGLGFDPSNHSRLGRGKGFYDRYLSSVALAGSRPPFIGVCFSPQLDTLVTDPHDYPMDRIVTEEGIY